MLLGRQHFSDFRNMRSKEWDIYYIENDDGFTRQLPIVDALSN